MGVPSEPCCPGWCAPLQVSACDPASLNEGRNLGVRVETGQSTIKLVEFNFILIGRRKQYLLHFFLSFYSGLHLFYERIRAQQIGDFAQIPLQSLFEEHCTKL